MTDGAYTGGGESTQPLQPLGVGGILDAAMKLYRRNATSLWKIVLLVVVPVVIIEELAILASLPTLHYVHNGTLYVVGGSLGSLGLIVTLVLSLLAVLVLNGALAICLVDSYIGNPIDWQASVRAAFARLGALTWLALMSGVLLIIGFIALVIPGIYLVTVWCVAVPALMFEDLNGFKALGRSFHLTRHRWWATFGALMAAVVMLIIALIVFGLIFNGIESALGVNSTGLWLLFRALTSIVGDLITYPFIAAVIAVMYIDLRVRKEGLNLELLAGALGRPSPSSVAPSPIATTTGFGDPAQPNPFGEQAPANPFGDPEPPTPFGDPIASQPTTEARSPFAPEQPPAGADTAVRPSPFADDPGATSIRPMPPGLGGDDATTVRPAIPRPEPGGDTPAPGAETPSDSGGATVIRPAVSPEPDQPPPPGGDPGRPTGE